MSDIRIIKAAEYSKEAVKDAVDNLIVEVQAQANELKEIVEVKYQVLVITNTGATQYYILENGSTKKVIDLVNVYGVITAEPEEVVEEYTPEEIEETLEDTVEVEVVNELEPEIVEYESEPVYVEETETEEVIVDEALLEKIQLLEAENANLKIEIENLKSLVNVDSSSLIEFANDSKKLFREFNELNEKTKNFR